MGSSADSRFQFSPIDSRVTLLDRVSDELAAVRGSVWACFAASVFLSWLAWVGTT